MASYRPISSRRRLGMRIGQFCVIELFTEKLSVGLSSIETTIYFGCDYGHHLALRLGQRRRTVHQGPKEGAESNQKPWVEAGNLDNIGDASARPPKYPVDPTCKPTCLIFFKGSDPSHLKPPFSSLVFSARLLCYTGRVRTLLSRG